MYTPTTVTTPSVMKYTKSSKSVEVLTLHLSKDVTIYKENKADKGYVEMSTMDSKLMIGCKWVPFTVIFETKEEANTFGFNELETTSKVTIVYADKPFDAKKVMISTLEIEYGDNKIREEKITFKEYLLFPSATLLREYFVEHCSSILNDFKMNQNGLINFKIQSGITSIILDENLSNILGFDRKNFNYAKGKTHIAIRKPKLENAYNQMYIYSNLVEPILVGGVRVPLLKSVWVETKYNFEDIVHENIEHAMYLPASLSTINNIEIEIRNDSGQLINFPHGSITNLTLHFKKKDE
jgi:hypothetical protein